MTSFPLKNSLVKDEPEALVCGPMINDQRRRSCISVVMLLAIAVAPLIAHGADACSPAITTLAETAHGLSVASDCGTTLIAPWADSVVHVQRTPPQSAKTLPPSLVVIGTQPDVAFKVDRSDATNTVLSATSMQV